MFIRVVRFTGVEQEGIDGIKSRIESNDGPPEGVPSQAIKILYDASQRTAIALQYFNSMEDLEQGAAVLGAMDASETPGTRASVDACEVVVEVEAGS